MSFFNRLFLVCALAFPALSSAQGFLFGLTAGGMLAGGNNQSGNQSSGTVLFIANEETLKRVNPLQVRQAVSQKCFTIPKPGKEDVHRFDSQRTLAETFESLTAGRGQKKRTVLQVLRIIIPDSTTCASLWFTFIEE